MMTVETETATNGEVAGRLFHKAAREFRHKRYCQALFHIHFLLSLIFPGLLCLLRLIRPGCDWESLVAVFAKSRKKVVGLISYKGWGFSLGGRQVRPRLEIWMARLGGLHLEVKPGACI
jgi:hypothetical protein